MTEDSDEQWLQAQLQAQQRALRARGEDALRRHSELRSPALAQQLVVEYRCGRKNCLLFRCWQTPEGAAYFLPAYKLERTRNAATSAAQARAERTTDGERRWFPQAGWVDDLYGDLGLSLALNCDHRQVLRSVSEILGDRAAGEPGKPTRRVF